MAVETVLITLGSMFAMVAAYYLIYWVIRLFREDAE